MIVSVSILHHNNQILVGAADAFKTRGVFGVSEIYRLSKGKTGGYSAPNSKPDVQFQWYLRICH